MKLKDVPIFKQRILDMLPITQADMWRKLEIGSREGSFIVDIMLKENLITRRRQDSSFLLEKPNGNGNVDNINKDADIDIKKKTTAGTKKKTTTGTKKRAGTETKKKTGVDTKKEIELVELDLKKDIESGELDLKKEIELGEHDIIEGMEPRKPDLKKEIEPGEHDIIEEMEPKKPDLKKEIESEKSELKKETEPEEHDIIEEMEPKKPVLKKDVDFVTTTYDKNIQNIKILDVDTLKQKVMDILPILQAEVWKKLDACDCNYLELIDLMVKEGLVARRKEGKFFMLEAVNKEKRRTKKDVSTIIPDELGTRADVSISISDEHLQKKVPKDANSIKKEILDLLPIAPSDILGKLDVTNRVCSNTINSMIEEKLIVRTEKNGLFLLEKVNKIGKKENINYTAFLSSKNRFAPCCGCALECDAAACTLLTEWLLE